MNLAWRLAPEPCLEIKNALLVGRDALQQVFLLLNIAG
jgi:hypothetical protein